MRRTADLTYSLDDLSFVQIDNISKTAIKVEIDAEIYMKVLDVLLPTYGSEPVSALQSMFYQVIMRHAVPKPQRAGRQAEGFLLPLVQLQDFFPVDLVCFVNAIYSNQSYKISLSPHSIEVLQYLA